MSGKLPRHLEHGEISSSVILAPAEEQSSVNGIDKKLTGGDVAFIEGCVRQGMGPDDTYFALTKNRLDNGRGRIIQTLVVKEWENIKARQTAAPCAITGQDATHVMAVTLASGDDEFLHVEIPVSAGVVNALSQRGVNAKHEFYVTSRIPSERLASMEPTSKFLKDTRVIPLVARKKTP